MPMTFPGSESEKTSHRLSSKESVRCPRGIPAHAFSAGLPVSQPVAATDHISVQPQNCGPSSKDPEVDAAFERERWRLVRADGGSAYGCMVSCAPLLQTSTADDCTAAGVMAVE